MLKRIGISLPGHSDPLVELSAEDVDQTLEGRKPAIKKWSKNEDPFLSHLDGTKDDDDLSKEESIETLTPRRDVNRNGKFDDEAETIDAFLKCNSLEHSPSSLVKQFVWDGWMSPCADSRSSSPTLDIFGPLAGELCDDSTMASTEPPSQETDDAMPFLEAQYSDFESGPITPNDVARDVEEPPDRSSSVPPGRRRRQNHDTMRASSFSEGIARPKRNRRTKKELEAMSAEDKVHEKKARNRKNSANYLGKNKKNSISLAKKCSDLKLKLETLQNANRIAHGQILEQTDTMSQRYGLMNQLFKIKEDIVSGISMEKEEALTKAVCDSEQSLSEIKHRRTMLKTDSEKSTNGSQKCREKKKLELAMLDLEFYCLQKKIDIEEKFQEILQSFTPQSDMHDVRRYRYGSVGCPGLEEEDNGSFIKDQRTRSSSNSSDYLPEMSNSAMETEYSEEAIHKMESSSFLRREVGRFDSASTDDEEADIEPYIVIEQTHVDEAKRRSIPSTNFAHGPSYVDDSHQSRSDLYAHALPSSGLKPGAVGSPYFLATFNFPMRGPAAASERINAQLCAGNRGLGCLGERPTLRGNRWLGCLGERPTLQGDRRLGYLGERPTLRGNRGRGCLGERPTLRGDRRLGYLGECPILRGNRGLGCFGERPTLRGDRRLGYLGELPILRRNRGLGCLGERPTLRGNRGRGCLGERPTLRGDRRLGYLGERPILRGIRGRGDLGERPALRGNRGRGDLGERPALRGNRGAATSANAHNTRTYTHTHWARAGHWHLGIP